MKMAKIAPRSWTAPQLRIITATDPVLVAADRDPAFAAKRRAVATTAG